MNIDLGFFAWVNDRVRRYKIEHAIAAKLKDMRPGKELVIAEVKKRDAGKIAGYLALVEDIVRNNPWCYSSSTVDTPDQIRAKKDDAIIATMGVGRQEWLDSRARTDPGFTSRMVSAGIFRPGSTRYM